MKMFGFMRFGLRLRFKDNFKALDSEDEKEKFFSQLNILYKIDPFRYLLWFLAVFGGLLFGFGIKSSWLLFYFYLIWIVVYILTVLGVYYMNKDVIEKQDLVRRALEDAKKDVS